MINEEIQYIVSIIARQFYINVDENVFSAFGGSCFSKEMKLSLTEERQIWLNFPKEHWKKLSEFLVHIFLKSFYETNQYLNFKTKECIEISKLFDKLFLDICEKKNSVHTIEVQHYERLRQLEVRFQPMLSANSLDGIMNKYVCSEYSAKFQLKLLKIAPSDMLQPILDIGCGEHGYLVTELRKQSKDAYGLDRMCRNENGLIKCSWFDFDYGEKKWGTILSNLSFSSHFLNNMLNNSCDVGKFEEVYHKILNSLIPGGSWHYAPSLPHFEDTLSNEFIIISSQIDDVYCKTKIQRKALY